MRTERGLGEICFAGRKYMEVRKGACEMPASGSGVAGIVIIFGLVKNDRTSILQNIADQGLGRGEIRFFGGLTNEELLIST